MNDNIMGTYVYKDSFVHSLSSKTKLFALLFMIVYTVLCKNPLMYVIDFALALVCALLSKINILRLMSFIKRIWLFLLVILLMNTLFFSKDNAIYSIGFISITVEGFFQGLKICLNVLLILIWSNILLSTTAPIDLMDAVEFLLCPLKLIKIPVNNLTLIISVSIQFVPILLEEATQIKKAQIARGAEFETKNILKKAKIILPLIVPIFVSGFKRADELSQALEARGYQGGNKNENKK